MNEIIMQSAATAAEVHERFGATGEGIVWAVVDSGIDGRHPQFRRHQNLELPSPLRHRDLTAPDLEEATEELEALVDVHGNGTFNAGLIAGELTASSSVSLRAQLRTRDEDSPAAQTLPAASGLAPRCKLISIKVLNDDASRRTADQRRRALNSPPLGPGCPATRGRRARRRGHGSPGLISLRTAGRRSRHP